MSLRVIASQLFPELTRDKLNEFATTSHAKAAVEDWVSKAFSTPESLKGLGERLATTIEGLTSEEDGGGPASSHRPARSPQEQLVEDLYYAYMYEKRGKSITTGWLPHHGEDHYKHTEALVLLKNMVGFHLTKNLRIRAPLGKTEKEDASRAIKVITRALVESESVSLTSLFHEMAAEVGLAFGGFDLFDDRNNGGSLASQRLADNLETVGDLNLHLAVAHWSGYGTTVDGVYRRQLQMCWTASATWPSLVPPSRGRGLVALPDTAGVVDAIEMRSRHGKSKKTAHFFATARAATSDDVFAPSAATRFYTCSMFFPSAAAPANADDGPYQGTMYTVSSPDKMLSSPGDFPPGTLPEPSSMFAFTLMFWDAALARAQITAFILAAVGRYPAPFTVLV